MNRSTRKLTGVFDPLQISTVFVVLSQTAPEQKRKAELQNMGDSRTKTRVWTICVCPYLEGFWVE